MPALQSASPSSGASLEALSDQIDTVNILKGALQSTSNCTDTLHDINRTPDTQQSQFRQYEDACDSVKAFYKEQHEKQTVAYNLKARLEFKTKKRGRMTVWEAMEKLNTLIDASDPDTSLPQLTHLLQSAEACRRDGQPRWMQLTALIHDLGKLLLFFGAQGQWDVVGDTFVVGCAVPAGVIYRESFAGNPDAKDPVYSTRLGIYSEGCGLDNLMLSWGHDEYLYRVVRHQSTLPQEALAVIRYHSFYPWHREGAYAEFMAGDGRDERMLEVVRRFNRYDLYSKSDEVPDVQELKPYYLELIDEFFPQREIEW